MASIAANLGYPSKREHSLHYSSCKQRKIDLCERKRKISSETGLVTQCSNVVGYLFNVIF